MTADPLQAPEFDRYPGTQGDSVSGFNHCDFIVAMIESAAAVTRRTAYRCIDISRSPAEWASDGWKWRSLYNWCMLQRMPCLPATLISLIVATLLYPGCSHSPSTDDSQPAEDSLWSVQLHTSGGFGGIGNGDLLVTSEGKITYEPPRMPGKPARSCKETISGEQLEVLRNAVSQSKPGGWNLPGLAMAAPDAFGYELELHRGNREQVYKVKWYDNTRDQLPDDLKKLSEVLNETARTVAKHCPGQ
jgi:hypothetical protein